MTRIQSAAHRAIKKHGGVVAAAGALGIHHGYLSRLASGQRSCGPRVLRKLGLKRTVLYAMDR
jgi:hypothetical protein